MILSIIGILLGVGGILLGQMLEGGHIDSLIQPTAAIIVFCGTFGATMLSSSMGSFSAAMKNLTRVFLGKNKDFHPLIKEIIAMANVARKDGILGLEGQINSVKNQFLKKCFRYLIDGYDPKVLEDMMYTRMDKEEGDKAAIAKVWETAGGFAPTIGIIGAVLGLIHVMSNLSDSSKLGGGIAVAFVATVYGVGSANLFMLPVANKMKVIFHEDMIEYQLIIEGVLGIQAGLNPRVIEDKLNNILGGHGGGGGEAGAEKKAA